MPRHDGDGRIYSACAWVERHRIVRAGASSGAAATERRRGISKNAQRELPLPLFTP